MKRQDFAIVALAAVFGLGSPAALWAQGRGGTPVGTAEARGGGGGESSGGGSAVPRSGGDGSSSGGTSSGGASSTSSTPSTPSMNPSYIPPSPSAEAVSYAPQRRGGGGGGNSGGGQAVPRGSSGSGGGGSEGARSGARAPSGTTSSSAGANENGGDRRAVPTYSRPRGDHPATGEAVQRQGPRPGSGGDIYIYPGYPYYYGSYPYYGGYWGSGYGYGLGYMYDPFWSPFGYGGGYGGGYGYGDPYGGYYVGGGSGGYGREARDNGSLRLKIKPREAQVYVDGYLVGDVDSFDGAFQKLGIESGGHRVELKADGYEPIQFDVLITAGETVTYKGEMKPIK